MCVAICPLLICLLRIYLLPIAFVLLPLISVERVSGHLPDNHYLRRVLFKTNP